MPKPESRRFMERFSEAGYRLKAVAILAGLILLCFLILAFSPRARMQTVRTTLGVMGASLPTDDYGQTNILLLGVGDENHDAADLTDTMILASIDPIGTRSVVMLSLPRDLFLDTSKKMANGRINAVYANEKHRLMIREKMTEEEASQAAMNALAEEMSRKLGIEIHGAIKTNFTAFETIVDALGGVDIEVKERIADYTYPLSETRVGLFQIDAGMQHFDGETALKYARSRHSTSDFDRSARQQQLLSALASKVRSMGRIAQIRFVLALYERLQEHVETTLEKEQLLGLAQIAADLSLDRMITMQVNFNTGGDSFEAAAGGFVFPAPPELFEGASILIPMPLPGGTNDWKQISTFAQVLTQYRSVYLTSPMIDILDEGARRLEAHRLRNELRRYGFNTGEITYAPDREAAPPRVYYRTSDDKAAAELIGALLSMPVEKDASLSGTGGVLIRFDSSFSYRPFATMSGAVLGN
jgi:LCP family protein required for cell wall assembly